MELYYKICTYVLAGILGLCVGSFLNVLIYRLPRGMNIAKPPSHCTTCDYQLKWYDNIPVLSYILLRGRCRKCGQRISPRYTFVELANCLMWLACVWRFYDNGIVVVIAACVALSALMVEFFTDIECMMVPDSTTIAIFLAGLTLTIAEFCGVDTGVSAISRLWGFVFGLGFFMLFYFGFLALRGREGLGFGDVKLMGAAGLLLGLGSAFVCVIISCVISLISVALSPKKEQNLGLDDGAGEFPFAPYITFAAAFCLFFGPSVCSWYLNLFV